MKQRPTTARSPERRTATQAARRSASNTPTQNQWQSGLKKPLILGILALILSIVSSWVLYPQTLLVQRVKIEGNHRTTPEVLQSVISRHTNTGFLYLDLAAIQAALSELPWIAEAVVTRQWPDTLAVTLTEKEPFAVWQTSTTQAPILVSTNSTPIPVAPTTAQQAQLPHLIGADATVLVAQYRQAQELFSAAGLQARELRCSGRQACTVVLRDGLSIVLGRDHQFQHLQRFLSVYSRIVDVQDTPVQQVDLRYTNGIAVQLATAE